MLIRKLIVATATVLVLGTLAAGAGLAVPPTARPSHDPIPARTEPRPADVNAGRMIVARRVLDPRGRPMPGATSMVYASVKWPGRGDRLAPMWPRPAVSDAEGRFTLRGVGRGLRVGLVVDDPRFATLRLDADTDASSDIKDVTIALVPARIIVGRVTYADSGRPASHATVSISTIGDDGGSAWSGDFETDDRGRFRAHSGAAHRDIVGVFPPDREPYLHVSKRIEWPGGAVEQTVKPSLPRGVLVRGKVVEEGSGRPIAGARVGYLSHPDRDERNGATSSRASTAGDDSFQIGVMPAPGYLTVLGPGEDYIFQTLGQRLVLAGQPGGRRLYSHAFHRLDLKPGADSQEVGIALRPSTVVKGRLIGPDGQPVAHAEMVSRVVLQPIPVSSLFWSSIRRPGASSSRITISDIRLFFVRDPGHHGGRPGSTGRRD